MNVLVYRSNDVNIRQNSFFTEEIISFFKGHKDIHFDLAMEEDSIISLEKIKASELVIIFSHGSPWGLYHRLQDQEGYERPDYEILISNKKNIEYLRGKKVLAFACYTANDYYSLGLDAVTKADCEVYCGFGSSINRNLPLEFLEQLTGEAEIDIKNFISSIYSSVFKKTILVALQKNYSFDLFARVLKLSLKKEIAEQILHNFTNKIPFKYHMEGTKPVNETADSICVLGNSEAKFVS